MRTRKSSGNRIVVSSLALLLLAGTTLTIATAGQSDVPSRGIAVYVWDFDLFVAPGTAPDPPNPDDTDKPGQELRSNHVQEYFGQTLAEALQKQGYSPSRSQVLSGNGIILRGVFAQADQKNRIRRALLGSGSPDTPLILYVGAFTERNVSQPLYVEAPVQEPDPGYGPVIMLNSYVPMARYEIAKGFAEGDVRKICAQLVADLTALLDRNPAAVAHAKET